MTKTEFINFLKIELKSLKKEERNKFLDFYSEMINDKIDSGMSENEAVNSLENPKVIAAKILCDIDEKDFIKPQRSTASLILVIVGSPVWFSLLVAVFAVIIAGFCAGWAMVIAAFSAELGIGISSIACFGSFFVFLFKNVASAFGILGVALVLLALTLILIKPLKLLIYYYAKYSFVFLKKSCEFVYKKAKEIIFGIPNDTSNEVNNEKVITNEKEKVKEKEKEKENNKSEEKHIAIKVMALIALISGIALFTISFASVGFNIKNFSTIEPPVLVQKTEDFVLDEVNNEFSISEINLDFSYSNVKIENSNDNKIYIDYYESNKLSYLYQNENGKILLTQNTNFINIFDLININFYFNSNNVIIKIPNNYENNIIIHTTTGDVEINSQIKFNNIDVKSSTGIIKINSIITNSIVINATTGDINLENVNSSDKIDISTSTGDISMNEVNANAIKILTKTGCTNLYKITTNKNIIVEASTGKIVAENIVAPESANLKASTGYIKVLNISSKIIKINTSTGDIYGTIIGEEQNYKIVANTSTGNNNLLNSIYGENELYVTSSTGDINITFKN